MGTTITQLQTLTPSRNSVTTGTETVKNEEHKGTSYIQTEPQKADFINCTFVNCTFADCDLSANNFYNTTFFGCDFTGAKLGGLWDASTLENCDLTNATAADIRLDGCNIIASTFNKSDLNGTITGGYILDINSGAAYNFPTIENSTVTDAILSCRQVRQWTIVGEQEFSSNVAGSVFLAPLPDGHYK